MGTKRRMSNSSSYIGPGNNIENFNKRPRTPFGKIKRLLAVDVDKRLKKKNLKNRKLTEKEISKIRASIRLELLAERKRNLLIGVITIVILVLILGFFKGVMYSSFL